MSYKYLFILLIVGAAACSDTSRNLQSDEPESPTNMSPQVSAGTDQTVREQTTIVLSGSASDSDGVIVTYSWRQTKGVAAVDLTGMTDAAATFIAPAVDTESVLTFELTVRDNLGGSASDTVAVIVLPVNKAPTSMAGEDQNVEEYSQVKLSGQANDIDGTVESYLWSQVSGSKVSLLDAGNITATFRAPQVSTSETLIFSLTVVDNDGEASVDNIKITVVPPSNVTLKGVVQYGPFSIGSILELTKLLDDGDLANRQVKGNVDDELGNYDLELPGKGLYIAKGEGIYRSVLNAEFASEKLPLAAVFSVTNDVSEFNINLLTHIQHSRVLYLIRRENLPVSVALKQAQAELVAELSDVIKKVPSTSFSKMNIFSVSDVPGSDYLLAISALFTQYTSAIPRPEKFLPNALNSLAQDFEADGKLDNSAAILSELTLAMKEIDPLKITESLRPLIKNNSDYSVVDLSHVLDTDLDGLVNSIDDDDDGDKSPDNVDVGIGLVPFVPSQTTFKGIEDIPFSFMLEGGLWVNQGIEAALVNISDLGVLDVSQYPTLTFTPSLNKNGSANFVIALTQGNAISGPINITIMIEPQNDKPEISGAAPTEVRAEELYYFNATAADIDGDPLSYRIIGLPSWASFDNNSGVLTGTPSTADIGLNNNITISVTDGQESTDLPSFSITVKQPILPAPMESTYTTAISDTKIKDTKFNWMQVESAKGYELELAKDDSFHDVVGRVDTLEATADIEIEAGRYYLRLRTVNLDGVVGPWSTTKAIKIAVFDTKVGSKQISDVHEFIKTQDEGFLVLASAQKDILLDSADQRGYWLYRLNSNGIEINSYFYPIRQKEIIHEIVESSEGDIYFCGENSESSEAFVVKLNASLEFVSESRIKSPSANAAYSFTSMVEYLNKIYVTAKESIVNDGSSVTTIYIHEVNKVDGVVAKNRTALPAIDGIRTTDNQKMYVIDNDQLVLVGSAEAGIENPWPTDLGLYILVLDNGFNKIRSWDNVGENTILSFKGAAILQNNSVIVVGYGSTGGSKMGLYNPSSGVIDTFVGSTGGWGVFIGTFHEQPITQYHSDDFAMIAQDGLGGDTYIQVFSRAFFLKPRTNVEKPSNAELARLIGYRDGAFTVLIFENSLSRLPKLSVRRFYPEDK